MKKRTLKKLATLTLGISLFGASTFVANNNFEVTASAKTKAAKVLSYKNIKNTKVHATKGAIYASAYLTRVSHYAKNYSHTTFTKTYQAKVKKANGKVAIYQYIKAGNTKGWIWHSYLKSGSATKGNSNGGSSAAGNSSVSSTKFPSSITKSAIDKSVAKLKNDVNIVGSVKHDPESSFDGYVDPEQAMATLSNGNKFYWSLKHPAWGVEVMPGVHSNAGTFSNSTDHWVMYFVSGKHYNHNGNVLDVAPHAGFTDLSGMPNADRDSLPSIVAGPNNNGNRGGLYNESKQIILMNKAAYDDTSFQGGDAETSW